jgi:hypothetical protein
MSRFVADITRAVRQGRFGLARSGQPLELILLDLADDRTLVIPAMRFASGLPRPALVRGGRR